MGPSDLADLSLEGAGGSQPPTVSNVFEGRAERSDFGGEELLALVDFNNIDPAARESDPLIIDALELVGQLIRSRFRPPTSVRGSDAVDFELRLYDGWIDKNGVTLDKYKRTVRLIPDSLAGLREGVRIRASAVTSMACEPNLALIGTYINKGQKMVDQMLAQDLHFFAASRTFAAICLIANDEDYVPVAIAAASRYETPIYWIRARPEGRNDRHLRRVDVTLVFDADWSR